MSPISNSNASEVREDQVYETNFERLFALCEKCMWSATYSNPKHKTMPSCYSILKIYLMLFHIDSFYKIQYTVVSEKIMMNTKSTVTATSLHIIVSTGEHG